MSLYRRDPDSPGRRFVWTAGTAVLVVHSVIILVLAGLALSSPHGIEWISDAVQAEFVDPDAPVVTPTQYAQPGGEMWAIGAD